MYDLSMRIFSFVMGVVAGVVLEQSYHLPRWQRVMKSLRDWEASNRKE